MTANTTNTGVRPANDNDTTSRALPSDSIRLTWAPDPRGQRLDGMWWPRSRDAAAELPELIAAASIRLGGPVTRVSLNIDFWDTPHEARLFLAGQVVRLGWFHHIDPHLVTAGRGTHDRLSIAVLPADLDTTTAERIADRLQAASQWPTSPATLLDLGTQSPAQPEE